jgi:hypothetical protein
VGVVTVGIVKDVDAAVPPPAEFTALTLKETLPAKL